MPDTEKIRDFAHNVNVDGRHEGARVSAVGRFLAQPLEGVAALAGSTYQLVIAEDCALVAALPEGVLPKEGVSYRVTGTLRASGELLLFPGIEIEEIGEAPA